MLLTGLSVVGFFWRQSVAQARRAEASQLLTLGRMEMETSATAALAHARASLELVDSREARLLALEALWRGPPATVLEGIEGEEIFTPTIDFSPDGNWLATADGENNLKLWSRSGGPPRILDTEEGHLRNLRFGPDSRLVATRTLVPSSIRLWSIPEGEVNWSQTSEYSVDMRLLGDLGRLFVFTQEGPLTRVTSWPVGEGDSISYGRLAAGLEAFSTFIHEWPVNVDPTGTRVAFGPWFPGRGEGNLSEIHVIRLDELGTSEPELLAAQPGASYPLVFHPDGQHLIAGSQDGTLRIYTLSDEPGKLVRTLQQPPGWVRSLRFDTTGTWLASASLGGFTSLWNLEGPMSTTGTHLTRSPTSGDFEVSFHPTGDWLATVGMVGATLWPVDERYPRVLTGHDQEVTDVAFDPNGEWLASTSQDGSLKLWPLDAGLAVSQSTLFRSKQVGLASLSIDRSGRKIAVGSAAGQVWIVPLEESPAVELTSGFQGAVTATAFSHDGHLVAAAGGVSRRSDAVIWVWNLVSGESEVLDAGDGMRFNDLEFAAEDRLISASQGGLRIWELQGATSELLDPSESVDISLSLDGRYLFSTRKVAGGTDGEPGALLWDLRQGTTQSLISLGDARRIANDPSARLVVASSLDEDAPVRVSLVAEESNHLIFSHQPTYGLAVSPDSLWIAGLSRDENIRLWPMPDMSRPPLQTLPLADLLATLDSLTNYRVIRDPEATTGWRLDVDPFPGWERRPEW
jgi:WD40 repeat protein